MIKTLGKYQIEAELGRGAMGIVYKGYDPNIDRTVAIKTMLLQNFPEKERVALKARFKNEARAAGKLHHPNIVTIHDYGENAEQAYIAMEFVKGKELQSYLDEGHQFNLKSVIDIMTQLLEALAYSHSHKIIHRDIKPANIMIQADGQIKVTDFGIARLESSNLTATGMVLGTPSYMSPEQCQGIEIDGRSDLFSAGVILYQLLTGEKPFIGNNITAIMHRIINHNPEPPSLLNVQIPKLLDHAVQKALAKSPQDRFNNAKEFIATLQDAIKQPGTVRYQPSTMEVPQPDLNTFTNNNRQTKSKSLSIATWLVLILLLASGFGLIYWKQPQLIQQVLNNNDEVEVKTQTQLNAKQQTNSHKAVNDNKTIETNNDTQEIKIVAQKPPQQNNNKNHDSNSNDNKTTQAKLNRNHNDQKIVKKPPIDQKQTQTNPKQKNEDSFHPSKQWQPFDQDTEQNRALTNNKNSDSRDSHSTDQKFKEKPFQFDTGWQTINSDSSISRQNDNNSDSDSNPLPFNMDGGEQNSGGVQWED